ncbi:MAG: class I tRNA ligase family protein [Solirubrobacterales bacterium]
MKTLVLVDDVRPAREPGFDCVRRYLVADLQARFRRQRGDEVVFALGVQAPAAEIDAAAAQQGQPAERLIESYRQRICARLEGLAVSCEWERTSVSSATDQARELQAIFTMLLERDLVYRAGANWFFRSSRFAGWCEHGLEQLAGWRQAAIEAQRRALDRVDGVELTATLLGAGELVIFTTTPAAVERAEFIAVSPRHPDVATIVGAPALQALDHQSSDAAAVQTALQAALPGVERLLPVVLTRALEERAHATASLGVPEEDEAARLIAGHLQKGGGLPFRTHERGGKLRPASRFGLADLAVSRRGAWGTAVPVLHCRACGAVPLSAEARASDSPSPPCPSCGGPAERDPGVLSADFEAMWRWLSAGGGGLGEGGWPGGDGARRVLVSAGDGNRLLHQRIAAAVAAGSAPDSEPGQAEAFAVAAVVGRVEVGVPDCVGSVDALDELVSQIGVDAVRFALLDAAGPSTVAGVLAHSIRHAERFLAELRDYAEPRLRAVGPVEPIDPSTQLRRRLRAWCRVGAERTSAALERLDGKRATHELTLFLRRIEDFEERAAAGGELDLLDRQAVAFALASWAEVAEPCLPEIASELAELAAAPAAVAEVAA